MNKLAFKPRFNLGNQGVVGIEMALVLPIMVFIIFATIETYQYYRTQAIIDRAAYSIADAIASQKKLYARNDAPQDCTVANDCADDIDTYELIADSITAPLDFKNNGKLIVNFYQADQDGTGEIYWQDNDTINFTFGSGPNCNLGDNRPDPANLDDKQLALSLCMSYEPYVISSRFWENFGGSVVLGSTVFYRPRATNIDTLSGNNNG